MKLFSHSVLAQHKYSGVQDRLALEARQPHRHPYIVAANTFVAVMAAALGVGWVRAERNHPAASQERGIENSDQPQSRQTSTSGGGFIGG